CLDGILRDDAVEIGSRGDGDTVLVETVPKRGLSAAELIVVIPLVEKTELKFAHSCAENVIDPYVHIGRLSQLEGKVGAGVERVRIISQKGRRFRQIPRCEDHKRGSSSIFGLENCAPVSD